MAHQLFAFPKTVNDVAARTVASGVVVMASVAIATHQAWITIPLAYGFVARALSGPRFSPLALFATRFAAPRLVRYEKMLPGPPKRFAQAMGAIFTVSALIFWLTWTPTAAFVMLGVLLVPAFLEAAFGYCVGCKIFGLAMRLGVVPTSVCEQCGDLWSVVSTSAT